MDSLVPVLVMPPVMTGLWIVFVRVNNTYSLRQIAPQPWLTLFKFYMIAIFLTVIDHYAKIPN
jgi:hypothetical protein